MIIKLEEIILSLIREFIVILKLETEALEKDEPNDKRTKNLINLKKKSVNYLLLGEYKSAFLSFNTFIDIAKLGLDNIQIQKGREGLAISLFLDDYFTMVNTGTKNSSLKDFKFNIEIESTFETAATAYKKLKSNQNAAEVLFRLASYYLLFEGKLRQFLDTMKKIYDEVEPLPTNYKLTCLFKIKTLYESINMKRKTIFFLYMAMGICFENTELVNMLPFLFKEITPKLYVYDIFNEKIENPEMFLNIHKKIAKSLWKKHAYFAVPQNQDKSEMKETNKKRVDREFKLYVVNRVEGVKNFLLNSIWEPIQYNLYMNLCNFYKITNDLKM
jgi:hypothetical protein